MTAVQLWCRVTLTGPDGARLASYRLEGTGNPDLGTLDDVARLALLASRLGGGIVLANLSRELLALLELAGLRIDVERQPELGKESVGVEVAQEEAHPGNLAL